MLVEWFHGGKSWEPLDKITQDLSRGKRRQTQSTTTQQSIPCKQRAKKWRIGKCKTEDLECADEAREPESSRESRAACRLSNDTVSCAHPPICSVHNHQHANVESQATENTAVTTTASPLLPTDCSGSTRTQQQLKQHSSSSIPYTCTAVVVAAPTFKSSRLTSGYLLVYDPQTRGTKEESMEEKRASLPCYQASH
jgi:hypothetical protein